MRRTLWTIAVGVAMAFSIVRAQAQGTRAWVLDQGAQTLTAVDIETGKTGQSAKLEGSPSVLLRTAGDERLLTLDRGQGKDAGDAGFQAKTRSAVTIVNARTLAVQARVELCWGLEGTPMLSASGDRLSVVCPGYRGKTPAENLPREIVTVDLVGGKVISQLELPRVASAFFATPDGRTGVVLSVPEKPKNAAPLPAELRFVDLTAGSVAATVALEGDPRGPVLAPDGQFVYLLDRGKPSGNPEKNVNGKLHAVSMTTRAVEAVSDVGSKPRGLVLDEARKQLLLLSDGAPFKGPGNNERPGELRVIRGATPAAPIPVVGTPERIETSADGKTLDVFGLFGLTRLPLPGLTPAPMIKAIRMGEPETAVSADGRRGWVLMGEYFYTHDLEKGVEIESVRTGRNSKKLWAGVQSVVETQASKSEARRDAEARGQSYYVYTEYTVRPARGALAVVPGGKAIYAMNSMTDDVTVVDAETGQVIKKVAAGGFIVEFMPTASIALVVSPTDVQVLDYASHEKLPNLVTDSQAGFDHAELAPDAKSAVIHGAGGLVLVSLSNGKPTSTVVPFKQIAGVAIDWSRPR